MNDDAPDPPDPEHYGPATALALELSRLKREVARLGGPPMIGFWLSSHQGAAPLLISDVAPGSEAALAGLEVGDELLMAGEQVLGYVSDVREALRARDQPVLLLVRRGGSYLDVRLFVPRVPACPLTEEQLLSL